MAEAIERAHDPHWSKERSASAFGNADYPEVVLDNAFARLYESEKDARFFIAMPPKAHK